MRLLFLAPGRGRSFCGFVRRHYVMSDESDKNGLLRQLAKDTNSRVVKSVQFKNETDINQDQTGLDGI